jgi:hypothetical protein
MRQNFLIGNGYAITALMRHPTEGRRLDALMRAMIA